MELERLISKAMYHLTPASLARSDRNILDAFAGVRIWSILTSINQSYAFQHLNHDSFDVLRFVFGEAFTRRWRAKFDPYLLRGDLVQRMGTNASARLPPFSFRYQPLPSQDHIRLIRILAGPPQSKMSVSFMTVRLADAPPFETLSYVWGLSRFKQVDCEGEPIMVRENVHVALHSLRTIEHDRVFWIDSLCINQEDLDERAEQVSMMRLIFMAAQKTLVCLGEAANLPNTAVAILRTLSANAKERDSSAILDPDRALWESIGRLYADMWFHRVWIIQEVTVASCVVIQIGQEWWDWDDFAEMSLWAYQQCKLWHSLFDPTPVLALQQIRLDYHSNGPYPTVPDALIRGRNALATLDQDKVYALLGLTNEPFETDYKETVSETYIRVAKAIVTGSLARTMFDHVDDHVFRLKRGLPSWVPDWEVRHGPRPLASLPQSKDWQAALHTRLAMQLDHSGRRLRVVGFIIDQLDRVGDAFLEESPVPGAVKRVPFTTFQYAIQPIRRRGLQMWTARRVQQWNAMKDKYATMYKSEDRDTAFWHTLIGGSLPPGEQSDEVVQRMFQIWSKVWIMAASNSYEAFLETYSLALNRGDDMAAAMSLFHMHVQAAWGRRFYVTGNKGIMGVGPFLSRRNDLLVVLHGVSTPVILRRQKEAGTYRFVGQVYAHGIMYGEAMAFEESAKTQSFVLV